MRRLICTFVVHIWHRQVFSGRWLHWCFVAFQHFSGHVRRGHLTYPHCFWASLLGSLPVLSAHSFASNWQLPFLNQQKGENGCRNYFMTNLHGRMLPDVRIEPTIVRADAHPTELPCPATHDVAQLGRVKRIWYSMPMWAAKVQASLRIRADSPEPPLLAQTSSDSRGSF